MPALAFRATFQAINRVAIVVELSPDLSFDNLQRVVVKTSHGKLHLLTDRNPWSSPQPIVLTIHGSLRKAEHLVDWYPALGSRYTVILADLAGHGDDDGEGNPTLSKYAKRVHELVTSFNGRKVFVLGESLGGLVALGLAQGTPNLTGVIAADPPLSTAKQWYTRLNCLQPDRKLTLYQKALLKSVLGLDGGEVTDKIYYSLIEKVALPTLVMTGDRPLFPVNTKTLIAPCAIDEVDKAVITRINNPHVSVRSIKDVGHLCMDATLPEARQVVTDFCDALAGAEAGH